MYGDSQSAKSLAESITTFAASRPAVDVIIAPSYTLLSVVREFVTRPNTYLGAQDVCWIEEGAFTGQISALMLVDAGCQYCIVGHSEKRGRLGSTQLDRELIDYFSDTDETVKLKVAALISKNVRPILCVGETEYERSAGETSSVILHQVSAAFDGLSEEAARTVEIAYEPVWAIGTGNVCDPIEANNVCGNIREMLAELVSQSCADSVRLLYGGSVKANNAGELLSQPEIDGALVGGASLDAAEFQSIIGSVTSE